MSMGYGFGFTRARRASSGGGGVSAPVNTVLPVITGTTTQGELLSVSNGTWTNSPSSYAYQWKRAGSNISGATSATYVLSLTDVGSTITCTVTATNAGGSTSATSTATATIAAGAPVTADYTVYDDDDWTLVFGNSDATLSGKVVAVSGTNFTTRAMASRTFSPPLTITSADASSKLPALNIADCSGITFSGLNVQCIEWPKSTIVSLVRFSGSNFNLRFINSTFRQGYGAGFANFDPTADYPEYATGGGLPASIVDCFSSQGGTFNTDLEIRGCTITDVSNAIKGLGSLSGTCAIWDNTVIRVYQDIVSLGKFNPSTSSDWLLVQRNTYALPFCRLADGTGPHGDIFQIGSSGPVDTGQIIYAGNRPIYQARRSAADGTTQGCFISDTDAFYYDISIIGNILVGGATNAIAIGEGAVPDPTNHIFLDSNTIIPFHDGGNTPRILLIEQAGYTTNNFVGRTICMQFPTADDETTIYDSYGFSFASPTATFPNWADRTSATTVAATLAAFSTAGTAAATAGAADRFADLIDLTTNDPFAVVKWQNVLPGVDWPDQTGLALSTLITLPLKKVLGGPMGMTVAPSSGVEWRSFDTDGTTAVQAWTTSSGNIDRGQFIQLRGTTSGSELTAVAITAALNGVTVGSTATTALATPAVYFTIGSGSPNTYFFATANMSASTTRLIGRAKLYMTGAPASACHLFGMATNAWMMKIEADLTVSLGTRDSANAICLSAAKLKDSGGFDVVLTAAEWLQIIFDVDYAARTVTVTVNGTAYPAIAFTTSGSGSCRQQPALIGASTVGGATPLPAGWQLSAVSIDRNGSNYKTVPNDATSVNADTWKAGAAAT